MSTVHLTTTALPRRLQALRWPRDVYVRGALPSEGPAVAIVGSRAASAEGMARAERAARHLAQRHVHVISGGALGIDGAAHRGAVAGGGTTTVVLGNGLDILYPRRHAPLFRTVLASGGGLIGLQPDGTQPRPGMFPQRNPLIAALADAVLVIEADVRSGSLGTAAAATRFGRVLAAWPGSRGCDRLLATGAAILECEADIDRVLAGTPRMPSPPVHDATTQAVAAAIAAGAHDIDAIVAQTGLPVRAVLRALPLLERYS